MKAVQLFLETLFDYSYIVFGIFLVIFGLLIIFRNFHSEKYLKGTIITFGVYLISYLFFQIGLGLLLAILIGIVVSFTIGLLINIFAYKKEELSTVLNKQMISMGLIIIIFIGIIILFRIPLFAIIQTIFDYTYLIAALALSTMGILLVFKTSYTANFAQGTMATLGVFVTAYLLEHEGVGIWLSVLIGVGVGFIIGLLIDVVIIRHARRVTPVGKQMITMGLISVILAVIAISFGAKELTINRFFDDSFNFTILNQGFHIPKNSVFSILIAIVLISTIYLLLRFTKWGLGVRATASNELVAKMMGVNTRIITAMSWSIAGGLGAVAAILYASHFGSVDSMMFVSTQVNSFLASVLGGFSSFYGPIVGATFIPFANGLFARLSGQWADVILYSFILLVILIKPVGVFGKKVAKKV